MSEASRMSEMGSSPAAVGFSKLLLSCFIPLLFKCCHLLVIQQHEWVVKKVCHGTICIMGFKMASGVAGTNV